MNSNLAIPDILFFTWFWDLENKVYFRENYNEKEMITKNKFVRVSYELRTEPNGEVIERADEQTPLEFICGQGQTLEYFEMNLLNLHAGDAFDFRIPCANAYGERDEDMVLDLDREIFAELSEEDLQVGKYIPMLNGIGQPVRGLVLEVTGEHVKMDFNVELAGKDLYFKGKVVEVRDATDEELEALRSSKCGGCHGCGSGSSGCGSSDGCGCGGCH